MTNGTPQGNIILYQTEDGQSRIDVTLSDDTVWLTADQMAELFQRNKSLLRFLQQFKTKETGK